MNYLIVFSLLAAAVFAAPFYPADVFRGDMSPFAYQPAFHHESFAPQYNYIAPSHRFVDLAVGPTPYPAAPITQYVHHSIQVPVAPAPQIKYVQVPVPTPVVHVVHPEVKTVVVTKIVEKAPAPAPAAPARTPAPAPVAPARTPAPAPAPVQIFDSRESVESVEINSRED